jgi:hypothetical protein
MKNKKNKPAVIIIAVLLFQVSALVSCEKETPLPEIKSGGPYTVWEDDEAGSVSCYLVLSEPSKKTVTLKYSTADSTAVAGTDYTAVNSGTVTFNPGQTSKLLTVNIVENHASGSDKAFKIVLSDASNAVIKQKSIKVIIKNTDFETLTWSDDFDGASLNTATWNYEQGAGGWGNNELQTYTNKSENVRTGSGNLTITALNPSSNTYTSARITTQGKMQFTYGRVEIRAQLPEGKGIWPALWTLGSNISTVSWPKCGEIDIMELLGQEPEKVYNAIHWDRSGHVSQSAPWSLPSGKFSEAFHLFGIRWTPNKVEWYVDNNLVASRSKSALQNFPFDLPHFFIFNIAVGGNWPGSPDGTTVFPQNMIVDYIKLYQ